MLNHRISSYHLVRMYIDSVERSLCCLNIPNRRSPSPRPHEREAGGHCWNLTFCEDSVLSHLIETTPVSTLI